ncbi:MULTISPECIES: DUF6233 domain-containing protein [unclassified Streptomyces]|uniref:DUF6233 domain-containing protein n=1 Tax=unclassified Streptomyces TaxID=2593676 RepID=UPI00093E190D|nr:DUF6233 domain-containing protein [Streptomyces sp. CB01883]OKJ74380.1 hypothetical protein AMK32_35925 [Streptomyces sp. CB01883]
MSELPSDPPRLRAILAYLDQRLAESETVATYLRLQTTAVRQALAAAEKRPANGRRLPPPMQQRSALPAPAQHDAGGFVVEKQLHAGHPLGATVHRADCTVIQRDANPISADDGRQALTGDGKFFHACEFCRPDAHLGIPG